MTDPARLSVVYVGYSAQRSGAELALANLLPALLGVDPLVGLAEDGPLVERLRGQGIETVVLPLGSATREIRKDSLSSVRAQFVPVVDTLRYSVRLARLLRSRRPDLVHTNSLKAHLYGGVAARLAAVPQVWHARDRISGDYLPVRAAQAVRLAAHVLPAAVVANLMSSRQTLRSTGKPTAVMGYPVVYDAVPRFVRYNIDPDRPFTVGMVCRPSPWKGQDVFLRAFAQAFSGGEERARVVGAAMFGEDGYAASLAALARELGVDGRVDLRGFQPDVPAELAEMDVLVHASVIPEPFGQVVVEGMAAGLPVVAAYAGGPAEVVEQGRTGFLSPPGDVGALAEQLRELRDDPAARVGGRRVVDAPGADRVDVPPVGLGLRVDLRVAVGLRGGGEQEASALLLGQAQGVQGPGGPDLHGLDGQLQVVDR